MERESFENRIDELEVYKLELDKKIFKLQEKRQGIMGAIRELWRWWEAHKGSGEFGSVKYDGTAKVHILPKFGSSEAIEAGIKTRLDAQVEGDAEIAKAARTDKGKSDAQRAVDEIDKMNREPGKTEEGNVWS